MMRTQELETFLTLDESKCKPNIVTSHTSIDRDLKNASFNPFAERKLDHPTSNRETLTHLLKASLGTGILAMPAAFACSGLGLGIFLTVLVAVICTHCAYVLIDCAHTLYRRSRVTSLNFWDIAEISCKNGPRWSQPLATHLKAIILLSLFASYFGTCSVYTVIISKNFLQVYDHHAETVTDIRIVVAILLVPLVLLAWVPNLKYLAPISMVANVFMAVSLAITVYYLVIDMPDIFTRSLAEPPTKWPDFFSITIFAMEAIGVVMPLENAMETPQSMLGTCGILNQGMSAITLIYILLGFLGYARYGEAVQGSITLNLPVEDIAAQIVKISIGLGIYCSFGLQFFVCFDIASKGMALLFGKTSFNVMTAYVMRTCLVILSVALAIVVPTIEPFIGIIGSFCFSILGLIIPVIIELVTYWDRGFGKWNWILWKNIFIGFFGLLALVFGTKSAVESIIKLYSVNT